MLYIPQALTGLGQNPRYHVEKGHSQEPEMKMKCKGNMRYSRMSRAARGSARGKGWWWHSDHLQLLLYVFARRSESVSTRARSNRWAAWLTCDSGEGQQLNHCFQGELGAAHRPNFVRL